MFTLILFGLFCPISMNDIEYHWYFLILVLCLGLFRFQSLYETAVVIENGTKLNLGLSALCLFPLYFWEIYKIETQNNTHTHPLVVSNLWWCHTWKSILIRHFCSFVIYQIGVGQVYPKPENLTLKNPKIKHLDYKAEKFRTQHTTNCVRGLSWKLIHSI